LEDCTIFLPSRFDPDTSSAERVVGADFAVEPAEFECAGQRFQRNEEDGYYCENEFHEGRGGQGYNGGLAQYGAHDDGR
jgi:hypothetical protein